MKGTQFLPYFKRVALIKLLTSYKCLYFDYLFDFHFDMIVKKSFKNQNFRPKKALETELGSQGRRKNFEKNLMRDKKIWTIRGKVILPTSKAILARSL